MSLNLDGKKAVVAEVVAQVVNAQTIVLAEYRGIEVAELTQLRAKARQSGVYLRVLRNTLAQRAVAGTAFEPLAAQMIGPLIYGISADPVAAAKVLHDFAKTNDKIVLKAGGYGGNLLDKAGVQTLAAIPSREELLSKLLGVMKAPIQGFAIVLGALAKQREEAAGTPAVAAPVEAAVEAPVEAVAEVAAPEAAAPEVPATEAPTTEA